MLVDRNPRGIASPELHNQIIELDHGIVLPFDIPSQSHFDYPNFKIPVVASLDQFIAHVNSSNVDGLIKDFTKVNRYVSKELPEGTKFAVTSFGWCNRFCFEGSEHPFGCNIARSNIEGDTLRHVAGDYGLSIGVQLPDEPEIWLAVTSFCFVERLSHDVNVGAIKRLQNEFPEKTPIIVQLQGAHFHSAYPKEKEITREVLSRIPWEHILTALTVAWWKNVSDKPIYFLGSALNDYIVRGVIPVEKGLEKDQIAREVGFVDHPSGLLVFN